ncbi:MAG: FKBP-type peptidyl-prolyl cis-trans isomerase [Verrucomicrobiales bacterium]|nr:FKBP-type peptidyl-prolyl cis-trans isomerase [Verrucomicrobiales bacterium]
MKQKLPFLIIGLLGVQCLAADAADLKDGRQKFCYSLGLSIANSLSNLDVTLDDAELQLMVDGLKDQASGKPALNPEEMAAALREFQLAAGKALAEKAKAEGEAFLAENKQKDGVTTLASGLQYQVEKEGSGTSPSATDRVSVNYRGTFIDGKEFDSSYKRGQPAQFGVGGVIKGWTEALQLMKPGAKWKLFVPSDLAYGERGMGRSIPPNSTLIFEVELLEVLAAPPTPPAASKPQPVTSDIIKVPSKEEMEKGAKVEVIKASEVDKYIQKEKEKTTGGPKE